MREGLPFRTTYLGNTPCAACVNRVEAWEFYRLCWILAEHSAPGVKTPTRGDFDSDGSLIESPAY